MLSRIASTSTPLIGADAGAAGEAAFALGAEAPDCAVVTAAEDGGLGMSDDLVPNITEDAHGFAPVLICGTGNTS